MLSKMGDVRSESHRVCNFDMGLACPVRLPEKAGKHFASPLKIKHEQYHVRNIRKDEVTPLIQFLVPFAEGSSLVFLCNAKAVIEKQNHRQRYSTLLRKKARGEKANGKADGPQIARAPKTDEEKQTCQVK